MAQDVCLIAEAENAAAPTEPTVETSAVEAPTDTPGVTLLLPPPADVTASGRSSDTASDAADGAPAVAGAPHTQRASAFDGVSRDDHAALMKGLRRHWIGPGFKRQQHTLMLVRIDGGDATARRMAMAMADALGSLGDTYPFGPQGCALLAPDKPIRHMAKIADGLRAAVLGDDASLRFSAGIATMHRDDDPTVALCHAERLLRDAMAMPRGGVRSEMDLRAMPDHAAGETAA